MKNKGFEGGPFQLLIAAIIMGMSLVVGFYLMDMVGCWRCEEMARAEATDFVEKISSVGDGDKGSVTVANVELADCIEGFYLIHVGMAGEGKCSTLCPQHPDQCWVLFADSRCSGRFLMECIDIAGSMEIYPDPEDPSPIASAAPAGNEDPWISGAEYAFTSKSYIIRIEKSDRNIITLGRP